MKGKNWIKIVCVIMTVLMLTACSTSNGKDATTEPTSAPAGDNEKAEVTPETTEVVEVDFMWMSQNWNPVNWGNDPVTQKFTEKTGVKFICSAPSGDPDQIANVMLASGDYPSTMSMGAGATFDKYVAAGAFLAIDDISAEYNFPKLCNRFQRNLRKYTVAMTASSMEYPVGLMKMDLVLVATAWQSGMIFMWKMVRLPLLHWMIIITILYL